MTVDELRKALEDMDGDLVVLLSRDAEGNGFESLADVEPGSLWDSQNRELFSHEEELEDAPEHAVPAVVLWP